MIIMKNFVDEWRYKKLKKICNNINEIMAEVNLDNICIKSLKEFSERLNENRKKSDQIESLETKDII